MSKSTISASATGLPTRRLFLASGPAAAVSMSLRKASAADGVVSGNEAHPDQAMFDLIAALHENDAKISAAEDDAAIAALAPTSATLSDQILAAKPQTAKGVRAALGHLVKDMEIFEFGSDEIRPLIEAVLNSPALAL